MLDERIGWVLKKVDELGLHDRTLVLFQSDNGHSTEERAHFGGGSSGPYRGAKFSLFEGGIRLPAIVSWPGQSPEGQVRNQVVHACDWMPTLAELTGAKLINLDVDGVNILPVTRSATAPSPHEVLKWSGGSATAQWAVRSGDWKLIGHAQDTAGGPLNAADKTLFLASLREDISESHNLAGAHPEIVQRLLVLHDDWFNAHQPQAADAPAQDKAGNEK
jgi:arylsulfatase A-like enzyme